LRKSAWSLLRINKGTSRREEEHSWYPLECRLTNDKQIY
jgi:hypothetical protein